MSLPVNQFLALFLGSLLLTLGVTNIILILLRAFAEVQITKKLAKLGISWRDILLISFGLAIILITFLLKYP